MKPLHSKSFDVAHAKAGAPYCCRDGDEAIIAKWDRRKTSYQLGGYAGMCDMARSWTVLGEYRCNEDAHGYDLVMLPLGLIAGQPVFTGYELEMRVNGIWHGGIAEPKNRAFINCRWPAPAKVYPQTLMTGQQLADAVRSHSFPITEAYAMEARKVANAAIKHCVDAGQVVIPSEPTPGVRKHNPYTGHLRDQRDIASDPMGILIHCEGETVRVCADPVDRDARDLAIAQAVCNAGGLLALDASLRTIIATVPK